MEKLKQGDLVIDYEGDLVLVILNEDNKLAMVWLDTDNSPEVYEFIKTAKQFVDYHDEHSYTYRIVGNVKKAFRKLKDELPK